MDWSNSMLEVKNNSNYKITVLYSNSKKEAHTENQIEFFTSDNQTIYPNTSKPISISGKPEAWHNYINEGLTKKLYIYVFSVDTILKYKDHYSINDFVYKRQYLKLLEFSEKQLIDSKWQVIFQEN